MDKVKTILTGVFGALFSFFGLLTVPLILLLTSNIIDYITGLMATSNRNEKISSYKSFKGIKKKISMYLLIIVGFMIDIIIDYGVTNLGLQFDFPAIFACVVALWLVCNEILSILENLVDIGVAMPSFLMPIVSNIKSMTENKIKKESDNNE
jgi:toxin secretion/phage lysis holin